MNVSHITAILTLSLHKGRLREMDIFQACALSFETLPLLQVMISEPEKGQVITMVLTDHKVVKHLLHISHHSLWFTSEPEKHTYKTVVKIWVFKQHLIKCFYTEHLNQRQF